MPPDKVKVYRAKPKAGIHEQVAGRLNGKERSSYRARVLGDAPHDPTPFTHNGVTVKIRAHWYDEHTDALFVIVESAFTESGLALPLVNPYQFVNPPLKVADGTFRKEPHPLKHTDATLPDMDVGNTVENLHLSLQQIVADAVSTVARQRGVIP